MGLTFPSWYHGDTKACSQGGSLGFDQTLSPSCRVQGTRHRAPCGPTGPVQESSSSTDLSACHRASSMLQTVGAEGS